METFQQRAKEHFPAVLLTLLSIIQALALELLWNRLRDSAYLWEGGWSAAAGWAQVVAMFLGVVQIWLFYTTLVMRFRWVPTLRETTLPFVIGVLEFTLVDIMGPGRLQGWFALLALLFTLSVWESHTIFRRARRDPENREFFESVEPARLRDMLPSIASVVGLLFLALVSQLAGGFGMVAFLTLLVASAALVYQMDQTRIYWDRSVRGEGPGSA